MTFESLIAFAAIVFMIAVIPGPNALLVLFTALAKNRLMAFANVAGVALDTREVGFANYTREVYSMSDLPDGMYLLRIQSGDEQTTLKINVLK